MPDWFAWALLLLILLAVLGAIGTRLAPLRWLLVGSVAGAFLAWVPILFFAVVDPEGHLVGNAIGLGLLAWGGGSLAGLGMIVGLGAWTVELIVSLLRETSADG